MDNQKATENSTLTYTLGKHENYLELNYLEFLFDFASHFVVELNSLHNNNQFEKVTWLENITRYPTTLREHLCYAALHSDQMLDATPTKQRTYSFEELRPTERQKTFFSDTLKRCLNLADDLIILGIMINHYQTDIIQPLQNMQSELSAMIDQLTKLQTGCQTENLKTALNDLTGTYLALLEKQLKSIDWPLTNCQTAVNKTAKQYHALWQLAFENTIKTRNEQLNDKHEGIEMVQDIQPKIDQIWRKLLVKSDQTLKIDEISIEDLTNFRNKIYKLRIKIYKCHTRHYPREEKVTKSLKDIQYERVTNPVSQIKLLLEDFDREYQNGLDFFNKAQKEQSNFIPMAAKTINFAKLSFKH